MMSTTEIIRELAADVESAWRQSDYDEATFVDVAAECLARPLDLDFSSLAHAICEGAPLPPQRRTDQGFGEPALTLYGDDRFLIEAYCWHTGTPAIHQHAFSGAFRILTGRSVHSRYTFTGSENLHGLRLGHLRLQSVELLDRSHVTRIPKGSGLIHAAFHLDSPSMTLVVRTRQGTEPEPTYLPPGVAYDTSVRSHELHKRLQLLDLLNRTEHESYVDCMRAAVQHSDAYDGMACLLRAAAHRMDEETFLSFAELFTQRHGARMHQVGLAVVEERRRIALISLRADATDPGFRFFLACLLSFFERRSLFDAMEQFWGDPARAREEVACGVSTLLGGDADRRIVTNAVTRAWIESVSPGAFPEWASKTWGRTLTDAERGHLSRFCQYVRAHPLLHPLTECGPDGSGGSPVNGGCSSS